MAPSTGRPLGWGTHSRQAEKRAAAEPTAQAQAQKQKEQDVQAADRARALKTIVQSAHWWAVEELFSETFNDLLDSLTGTDDLAPDDILKRVGGLRMARALFEGFDATLGQGSKAFQRLTGTALIHIAAAKGEQPIPVAR